MTFEGERGREAREKMQLVSLFSLEEELLEHQREREREREETEREGEKERRRGRDRKRKGESIFD